MVASEDRAVEIDCRRYGDGALMAEYLLEMQGITKEFAGVTAISGIDLKVRPGEIVGLCGENGAGKSTLVKVLSAVHPYGTWEGTILWEGKELKALRGRDIVGSEGWAVGADSRWYGDEAFMAEYLLEMRGITKEFAGVKAISGIDLKVRPGEIVGLCGENGAGKSTLMKVLSAVHPYGTWEGTILWEGKELKATRFVRRKTPGSSSSTRN